MKQKQLNKFVINEWFYFALFCIVVIIGGLLWWFKEGTNISHPTETTKITQPQVSSYTKLATLLCGDKINWCQTAQTTPAEIEAELRKWIPDEQQIGYLTSSLKEETDVFSNLLILSPQFSPQYLKGLTDFGSLNFAQIVGEQSKLRKVYVAFQTFAIRINVPNTMPASDIAPVSSFAYKVTKAIKNTQTMPETKLLPIFSDADVVKAKFLKNVVEIARKNKVIHLTSHIKVFTALCQLIDDNVVEIGNDSICITPNPDKPTQQQCETLNDSQTKNLAEALLELRQNLKQQLSCEI